MKYVIPMTLCSVCLTLFTSVHWFWALSPLLLSGAGAVLYVCVSTIAEVRRWG